jgi:hypothetical protein
MTTFDRVLARVALACALAVVILLVLRSVAWKPSPTQAVLVSDGAPVERYAPLMIKAVPVERYVPPPVSPPVHAPPSVPVVAAGEPPDGGHVASRTGGRAEARPRKRERRVERDDPGPAICRGRGRYWIDGGRSWRCRRA